MPADSLSSPSARTEAVPGEVEHVVLALLSVAGATAACATHGDFAMVAALQAYYAVVAAEVTPAAGQVVKVLGDGVLVAFPIVHAAAAVAALRTGQERATAHWQAFDARCIVQVRATAGAVLRARLGPPGAERDDVYGATLNALFKLPPEDFRVAPALATRLNA